MTDPRRTQVEAVLKRYECHESACMTNHRWFHSLDPNFLPDLLACWPAPGSREALEQIIDEQLPSFCHADWKKHTADRLMAWRKGVEPVPGWCAHIYWDVDAWAYRVPLGDAVRADGWDRCPVRGCGKERPTS